MPREYSKEQLWELFDKLPEELQQAIFSAQTADHINNICAKNEIGDDLIPEIARYTGLSLLGLLAPEEFAKTLEQELKIEKEKAKKVSWEINRFIFYPVKEALWRLYHPSPLDKPGIGPPSTQEKPAKKQQEPERPDAYREPIE